MAPDFPCGSKRVAEGKEKRNLPPYVTLWGDFIPGNDDLYIFLLLTSPVESNIIIVKEVVRGYKIIVSLI